MLVKAYGLGGRPTIKKQKKKELSRIAPLRAGIVTAVLYGIMSLIFVPFLLLAALAAGHRSAAAGPSPALPAFFGLTFVVLMPAIYAIMGFIVGVLSAAVYNLVARWTGGLQFEVRDLAPTTA
ncbi:MAG: hypothetical protein HKL95_04945 [Phycisphaerae bacterium]|nr:hypothetical protein [Phycisphaerae bacterium]